MYRQGDVLIRPALMPATVTEIPRDNGRLVLAYGEATGHAHIIDAPPEEATLLTDAEQRTFLRLVTDAPLVHEEHGTIVIAPGEYIVIRQREYVPAALPRRVID